MGVLVFIQEILAEIGVKTGTARGWWFFKIVIAGDFEFELCELSAITPRFTILLIAIFCIK